FQTTDSKLNKVRHGRHLIMPRFAILNLREKLKAQPQAAPFALQEGTQPETKVWVPHPFAQSYRAKGWEKPKPRPDVMLSDRSNLGGPLKPSFGLSGV
ncbi:MAG TPA: hypothetical protein VFL96_14205, partial [Acidobacteriaceae bacterium]|nr:hypothetical protein [Acidobacteriaceae bacterium]